jgi:glycosyltransferase involved in cell wall biosynthesis
MSSLTVIILTYNETLHIRRAIMSAKCVAEKVVIVDSFSNDNTIDIARELGATVFQNPFISQAAQFQWALENTGLSTPWVMRMDADEFVTPDLIQEINTTLGAVPASVSGIIVKRQVHFMGQWIRHGGYYPVKLMRIWRPGHAAVEQRWMDEHIYLLQGTSMELRHDIVDENLNNLTWWISKHNEYATREAIDILSRKHGLVNGNAGSSTVPPHASQKRWYKNNLYLKLPLFIRACLYFHFRYFLQLGFLDGTKGLVWHFLQGFWYRFLVDAKILQIEWLAKKENLEIKEVLAKHFNYRIQ